MAELDDRLKRLVSDEQSMKRVLDLASVIMDRKAAAPSAPKPEPKQDPPPDMASLLSSLLDQGGGATGGRPSEPKPETPGGERAAPAQESGPDQTAALAAVLPQLLQALSGNGNLVKSERANLIRAMTPYLSEGRIGSLDRAMRMANVAKAVKSALHDLGR